MNMRLWFSERDTGDNWCGVVCLDEAADAAWQPGGQTGQPGGATVHETDDTQFNQQHQQVQVSFTSIWVHEGVLWLLTFSLVTLNEIAIHFL